MKQRLSQLYPTILIFAIFFTVMAMIQFSTPNLPDNDGFYHIKLAWLMRTEGLKPIFTWLPLTILNPREFYDHHFLFHVALIPFTFGDLVAGAKWAAVTFASLSFLALWYLFKQQKISHAWLWSAGLMGVSQAFLYRMSITRPLSLSLAVLVLGLTWMLAGKYRRLGILAFIYVWLYDGFPFLIILASIYMAAVAITEKRLEIRPLLYVGAGIVLGMLINPYFPFDIIFSVRHILPKIFDATSVRVGSEWYPYTTEQLLGNSLPALVIFISGIFAIGLSGRKMDTRITFSLLATLFFGLMLFESRRFVEYFPAFGLIFGVFSWEPIIHNAELRTDDLIGPNQPGNHRWVNFLQSLKKSPGLQVFAALFSFENARILIPSVILVFVLAGTATSVTQAQNSMSTSRPFGLYAGASSWLVHNTPADSRVFQTDWDDFPRLFFYDTHNNYLIGLDPTYLQIADPALYNLWVNITQGKVANLSEIISTRFGSEYIHTDLNHSEFINVAKKDPGLKEVYRDDQAVIYQVVQR